MKIKLIIITGFFCLCFFKSYSQFTFDKGYFVDNENKKIECIIKNLNWRNNPTFIEYKTTEESIIKKIGVDSLRGFVIEGYSKYVMAVVEIDRTSDNIKNLKRGKNPEFIKEKLLLRVLIEGQAQLYNYSDFDINRFFFKNSESAIEQLVYKRYITDNNEITKNNYFKQQLFNGINCSEIPTGIYDKLTYTEKDLLKLFKQYNEYKSSNYTSYVTAKSQHRDLRLTLRPGFNIGDLSVENLRFPLYSTFFPTVYSLRFGVEVEYFFPHHKNKWSTFIEPTIQYLKAENIKGFYSERVEAKINYSSIQLPLGVRYYIDMSKDIRILINTGIMIDLPVKSSIDIELLNGTENFIIKSNVNFFGGVGVNFKSRFCFEYRYHTNFNITPNYAIWVSNLQTMSLILGYKINNP